MFQAIKAIKAIKAIIKINKKDEQIRYGSAVYGLGGYKSWIGVNLIIGENLALFGNIFKRNINLCGKCIIKVIFFRHCE